MFKALRQEMAELREEVAALREVLQVMMQPAVPADDLPDDMPGRDILLKAGITTRAAIPRTMRQLEQIPGMDGDTALDLARYLSRARR